MGRLKVTKPKPLDVETCQALVLSDRWLSKVQIADNGCHLWIAVGTKDGYGRVKLDGRMVYAHRVALVAGLGRDLAEGMEVGHVCHDRAFAVGECSGGVCCTHRRCVNPEHLEEQSRQENTLAGNTIAADRAARTHCSRGHALTEGNLVPSALPNHKCLTCKWELKAAISAAHKALGITQREYVRNHGSSRAVAEAFVNGAVGVLQ